MERSEISAPGSQIARDVRASRLTLYIALLCDHGILLTDGFTQIIDKLQQSFVVNKSVTKMKQTLRIDNLRLGNLPQIYHADPSPMHDPSCSNTSNFPLLINTQQ
jgi:hypothetical protein